METRQLAPEQAAAAMRAAGLRAPLPCDTPEGIAANGQCFELRTERGACVFVLRVKAGVLWIDGAAITEGRGVMDDGFALAAQIARQAGCKKVAFETSRVGLVRKARAHGGRVVGVVMELDIQ